jgi:uncharacterized RDD family membrane protein YckC
MTTPQDPGEPRPGQPEQPPQGQPPPPPPSGQQPPPPPYGQAPTPSPYGQDIPPYGQQPPAGYGSAPPPAYGQASYDAPRAGDQPGGPAFADWPLRAQSALVDWFGPSLLVSIVNVGADNRGLVSLLGLAALGWALYNAYLGGSTGQSYGKKWAGTRLVRASDGQLLGGGMGIVRYILHIVDALPCYLGFLWPLWDRPRQTFADKIVGTYVVRV